MLKPIWILCHSTCAVSFMLVCLHSRQWYTTCAWSILATYIISISRHSARILSEPKPKNVPLAELLDSESAALLAAAYLHLITPHSSIKLVPLVIYSLLNLGWYILHEAAGPTPLRWSLIELLRSTEPFLLTVASGADFAVLVCYFHHWYTGQTLLMPLVCLIWVCLKRLVHSCMARLLVHHVVDTIVAVFACVPFARSLAKFLVVLQRMLYCFVPVGLDYTEMNECCVLEQHPMEPDAVPDLEPPGQLGANFPRSENLSNQENITETENLANGNTCPNEENLPQSYVRKQVEEYQRKNTVNDAFLKKRPAQKYSINEVFLRPPNARKDFNNPFAKSNLKKNQERKSPTYLALRDPGLEEEFLSQGNSRPKRNMSTFIEPFVIANDIL